MTKILGNIECDKPQETYYSVPQALLTITVELMGALFQDLWSCLKQKFLKKRQSFQWKKSCGLFFLVVSNLTNVMEQFYRGP